MSDVEKYIEWRKKLRTLFSKTPHCCCELKNNEPPCCTIIKGNRNDIKNSGC